MTKSGKTGNTGFLPNRDKPGLHFLPLTSQTGINRDYTHKYYFNIFSLLGDLMTYLKVIDVFDIKFSIYLEDKNK